MNENNMTTIELKSKTKNDINKLDINNISEEESNTTRLAKKLESTTSILNSTKNLDSIKEEKKLKLYSLSREQLGVFVDLIYVAFYFNITNIINYCGALNYQTNILAVCYYLILFNTRYQFDVYSIIFYSTDIVHRVLFLIFNLSVYTMALNIKESLQTIYDDDFDKFHGYTAGYCNLNHTYIIGFAVAFVISRLSLIFLYISLIYFAIKRKTNASLRTYVVKVIPLILGMIVMCTVFNRHVNPIHIYLSVGLIEILGDILPEVILNFLERNGLNIFKFAITMRPDSGKLAERLQAFFMLIIGEALIGQVIYQFSTKKAVNTYLVSLFVFTMLFSMGTYFLTMVHRSTERQNHAMNKKSALLRTIYIWMHPIVCYPLFRATNSLNQYSFTLEDVNQEGVNGANFHVMSNDDLRLDICINLALIVFFMLLMRLMHRGLVDHMKSTSNILHILVTLLRSLLHYLIYYIPIKDKYFILCHSILFSVTNMFELGHGYVNNLTDEPVFEQRSTLFLKQSSNSFDQSLKELHQFEDFSRDTISIIHS